MRGLLKTSARAAHWLYWLSTLLLVSGVVVAYVLTIRRGHGWGDDFAQYLEHARNIATGRPYKATGHLINPRNQICPEVYPPVYPLLLAPLVSLVGPFAYDTLKLVGIGCVALLLLVWAAGMVARQQADAPLRPLDWYLFTWPLLVALAACPTPWELKDNLLSDVPYTLLQQVGLLACWWWFRPGTAHTYGRAAGLGILLYLPFGCRTTGFVLFGVFAATTGWTFRRAWRAALPSAVALLTACGLVLLQSLWLDSHDDDYVRQLLTYYNADTIGTNLRDYGKETARFWGRQWLPGPAQERVYALLASGLGLLALLGWLRRWRQRPMQVTELYFLGYGAIIICWPMHQSERFILPFMVLALEYVADAAQYWRRLARGFVPALGLVLAVAGTLEIRASFLQLDYIRYGISWPSYTPIFNCIRWLPANTVVLFEKPRALHLYTDHRTMIATSADSASVERDITFANARCLITSHPADYHPRRARCILSTEGHSVWLLPPPDPWR